MTNAFPDKKQSRHCFTMLTKRLGKVFCYPNRINDRDVIDRAGKFVCSPSRISAGSIMDIMIGIGIGTRTRCDPRLFVSSAHVVKAGRVMKDAQTV